MAAPLVIEVPDPSLIVLVGAAGAGKSTFAARHFAPDEVLSSDALREAIAGDPADQAANGPAFRALHRSLARRLAKGALTVVDATNVDRRARLELLRRARVRGVPAVAIVLDVPAALVRERNLGRHGRVVPADVVERQLAQLALAVATGGLDAEGFAAVHRLVGPDAGDAVEVRRVR
jgi:predicted kinase